MNRPSHNVHPDLVNVMQVRHRNTKTRPTHRQSILIATLIAPAVKGCNEFTIRQCETILTVVRTMPSTLPSA